MSSIEVYKNNGHKYVRIIESYHVSGHKNPKVRVLKDLRREDDLTALAGALVMVAVHVNEDTKRKARERLRVWFGDYDHSELDNIDEKMNKEETVE